MNLHWHKSRTRRDAGEGKWLDEFCRTLIHEYNSLPTFWWLLLIIAAIGAGVVNVLVTGKKIITRFIIVWSLLAVYVVFILMETIIGRKPGIAKAELIPFWFYSPPELRMEIILNFATWIITLFVFGRKKNHGGVWINTVKVGFIGFLLSASIEISQLVFGIGLFEVDDMIGNTIGCLIGR